MRPAGFLLALLLALPLAQPQQVRADTKKQSSTPNRFGAIAFHRPAQAWGVAYDFARARDANVHALKQCVNPQCEVVHRFRNGCAAIADGSRAFAAASGATRTEAEAKAQRKCNEQNKNQSCNVLAWACTR
jgi:hypothetical protein